MKNILMVLGLYLVTSSAVIACEKFPAAFQGREISCKMIQLSGTYTVIFALPDYSKECWELTGTDYLTGSVAYRHSINASSPVAPISIMVKDSKGHTTVSDKFEGNPNFIINKSKQTGVVESYALYQQESKALNMDLQMTFTLEDGLEISAHTSSASTVDCVLR